LNNLVSPSQFVQENLSNFMMDGMKGQRGREREREGGKEGGREEGRKGECRNLKIYNP
jgi:hypothetical protein